MTKLRKKPSRKLSFSDVGLEPKPIFGDNNSNYKQKYRKNKSLIEMEKNEIDEEMKISTKSELKKMEKKRKSANKNKIKMEKECLESLNDRKNETNENKKTQEYVLRSDDEKKMSQSFKPTLDEVEIKSNSFISLEGSFKSVSEYNNSKSNIDLFDDVGILSEENDNFNEEETKSEISNDEDEKVKINNMNIQKEKISNNEISFNEIKNIEVKNKINSLDDLDIIKEGKDNLDENILISKSENPSPKRFSKRKFLSSFANSFWDYMKPTSLDDLEKKQNETNKNEDKNENEILNIDETDENSEKIRKDIKNNFENVGIKENEEEKNGISIVEPKETIYMINNNKLDQEIKNNNEDNDTIEQDTNNQTNFPNSSISKNNLRKSKRQILYNFANSIWDYVKPISLDELENKKKSDNLEKKDLIENQIINNDEVSDSEFLIDNDYDNNNNDNVEGINIDHVNINHDNIEKKKNIENDFEIFIEKNDDICDHFKDKIYHNIDHVHISHDINHQIIDDDSIKTNISDVRKNHEINQHIDQDNNCKEQEKNHLLNEKMFNSTNEIDKIIEDINNKCDLNADINNISENNILIKNSMDEKINNSNVTEEVKFNEDKKVSNLLENDENEQIKVFDSYEDLLLPIKKQTTKQNLNNHDLIEKLHHDIENIKLDIEEFNDLLDNSELINKNSDIKDIETELNNQDVPDNLYIRLTSDNFTPKRIDSNHITNIIDSKDIDFSIENVQNQDSEFDVKTEMEINKNNIDNIYKKESNDHLNTNLNKHIIIFSNINIKKTNKKKQFDNLYKLNRKLKFLINKKFKPINKLQEESSQTETNINNKSVNKIFEIELLMDCNKPSIFTSKNQIFKVNNIEIINSQNEINNEKNIDLQYQSNKNLNLNQSVDKSVNTEYKFDIKTINLCDKNSQQPNLQESLNTRIKYLNLQDENKKVESIVKNEVPKVINNEKILKKEEISESRVDVNNFGYLKPKREKYAKPGNNKYDIIKHDLVTNRAYFKQLETTRDNVFVSDKYPESNSDESIPEKKVNTYNQYNYAKSSQSTCYFPEKTQKIKYGYDYKINYSSIIPKVTDNIYLKNYSNYKINEPLYINSQKSSSNHINYYSKPPSSNGNQSYIYKNGLIHIGSNPYYQLS